MIDNNNINRITIRITADEAGMLMTLKDKLQLDYKTDVFKLLLSVAYGRLDKK